MTTGGERWVHVLGRGPFGLPAAPGGQPQDLRAKRPVEFADRTKTFRTDLVYGENRDFTEAVEAVKAEIAKQLAALGC